MNKADLKAKWFKYVNTDKLVVDMMELLKKNGHPNSVHGVCTVLDEFFTRNEPMIRIFVTSKNYIGNLRIATKKEFERQISASEISNFFSNITEKLHTKEMLHFTDSNGKTLLEYLVSGRKFFNLGDLPNADEQTKRMNNINHFEYSTGATLESYNKRDNFHDLVHEFRYIPYVTLPRDITEYGEDVPYLRKGMKTSRAFNAVCHHYGVDKLHPEEVTETRDGQPVTRTVYPYDKVFAAYSDLVSDTSRKMWFIMSLNPLDYLTMSNGVSWHSCHNITNGGWKGGCLSYMLDSTSIITYVVSEMQEPIHEIPKVYRQMFHYENGLFIQNRLYPQGNDGATDLYEKFRGFVVEEFADLLHINGDWVVKRGPENYMNHIRSMGAHYKDYNSNKSCAVFYPTANESRVSGHVLTIGHAGICTRCGKTFTANGALAHLNKAECVL